ncbi:MAG: hypothetical protein ACI87A_000778 [Planctomycetota bacterium]
MTTIRNCGERLAFARVGVRMSPRLLGWLAATFAIGALAVGASANATGKERVIEPALDEAVQADQDAAQAGDAAAEAALAEALLLGGIRLDLKAGLCSVPARVLVRSELLEFLLVGPHGSAHESLLSTPVQPSLLNTALLALGVEPGQNVRYIEPAGAEPAPKPSGNSPGRRREDSEAAQVVLPSGDGLYLYLLWKEAGEVYFLRVEDLIRNLKTGRTMRRHAWVYLGSRFAEFEKGQPEKFVADREGNLINIAFFGKSNSLVTGAIEDCREQTIWIANSWMLPERGWPMQFVFARTPIAAPPADWVDALTDPMAMSSEESAESKD